jgi:transcriptional regulator with XRE-family HTH domain
MNGSQLRMARAALKMGVRELGELAQVSPNTVTRIEADLPSNPSTIMAVRTALEKAGVEFVAENGGGAGVRLKKKPLAVEEITEKIQVLDQKIAALKVEGEPSPEIGMNRLKKALVQNEQTKLKNRRAKIKKSEPK